MKKLFFLFLLGVMFTSCTVQEKLYSWENYHNSSYQYLKNTDEESTQQLLVEYEKIITNQKGTRNTVPPGIYADYGFLLLQLDRVQEGKDMLNKEVELYPESAVFVERILQLLEE